MSAVKPLEVKHNIQHDIHGVLGAVGYSTKFWTAVKKHSVSGTIPVVALNTFAQFSLAYLAAIMITSNDLSFMQNIKFFYLYLPSSYTFIAIALLVTAAASLTIGYVCRQEIKDEKEINENIRGGHSDGINEIPQNALTIKIIPDFNNKEAKNFSIIVPISGKQGTTLTNQREENRNQIIFLAVPYIISGLMIAGALAGFGFSNINGWLEISIISLAVVIAVVVTLVTLNNLKNNKVNQQLNIVTNSGNPNCIPLLNVFIPFSNSGVAYVMENKVEGEKGNEWYELADKHLTNLVDRICNLFDYKFLKPANGNIAKTLNGINTDINTTLKNLEAIVEVSLGEVKDGAIKDITKCLKNIAKSVDELCIDTGEDVKDKLDELNVKRIMDLINILKDKVSKVDIDSLNGLVATLEDRLARLKFDDRRLGVLNVSFTGEPSKKTEVAKGDEFIGMMGNFNKKLEELVERLKEIEDRQVQPKDENKERQLRKDMRQLERELKNVKKELQEECKEKQNTSDSSHEKSIEELNTKIVKIEKLLQEAKNKQTQSETAISSEASSIISADSHQDEEEEVDKKLNELHKKQRIINKEKEFATLNESLSKQKETDEWQRKINGSPQEFLHYLLDYIKLKVGEGETSLRDFDNKIIINWKDGSQTTCYINKQVSSKTEPVTNVNFVNSNIQAAYKHVFPSQKAAPAA